MTLLPEVATFLELSASDPAFASRADDIASVRRASAAREFRFDVTSPAMESEICVSLPVEGGSITLQIYRPKTAPALGAGVLLFFHGGGWVLCNADTHANMCRYLCDAAGVIGVNVDYRLAPEHRFPTAVNDAFAALSWTYSTISEHGGDPSRIVIAGDSAGGNLAAVVAQASARGQAPHLVGQALFYPCVGTGVRERFASWRRFGDGRYGLTAHDMDWMESLYLERNEQRMDLRFTPILTEDLDGVAPTLIIAADCDPLVDEGKAYAERLQRAGAVVDYRCFEGTVHAFISMAGAMPVGYAALDVVAVFIAKQVRVESAGWRGETCSNVARP